MFRVKTEYGDMLYRDCMWIIFPSSLLLEGQEDLVGILITPKSHIVTPCLPLINPLSKSP